MDASNSPTSLDAVAAPRWLDQREQRAWRSYLRMHSELLRHLNRQLQRDTELSVPDYEVLVHLSEVPDGRLRAFELGGALQWEKSRLSHHLTRMERRGLVAREECLTDTRGADVALTEAGRAAIEAAAPRHLEEVRRLFVDALTPDQLDTLAEISDVVLAQLADDTFSSGRPSST
jgi:DNA-binding MarR family transcriptional regulator